MTRLRVSPEAEEELADAAGWYEERRPGLGIELVAVIDREFEADEIVVVAIAHRRRKPGFWLDRRSP